MQFKYILKKITGFNAGKMISTAKLISKNQKKSEIYILLDMLYCMFKYQAGYNDYLEFEFYLLNGKERKTYLTNGINNKIVRKYNNKLYWHVLDDKIEFNSRFKKYVKREFLDLRKATEKEFENFTNKHKVFIAKPIDDFGGKNVEKIEINLSSDIDKIYNDLKRNEQFLVEEFIKQHKEMDRLYSNSVNTLRLFTFFDGKTVHYLQGVLKFGNGGTVDNFSSGGMYTFLDENGVVLCPAIDKNDNRYDVHPISGEKIVGFKVPMYKKAILEVKEAATLIPEVKYIGWDVAISNSGPIIIEGNSYPGIFQMKPSYSKTKQGLITKYDKYIKI